MTTIQDRAEPATSTDPLPFLGGAAWSLAGRVVAMATGTLASFLLARLLAPAELGAWFLLVTLVSGAALAGQLGLPGVVVRLVAEAVALGMPQRARRVASAALLLGTVGAVLAGLLLVFALGPWLLERVFKVPGMLPVLLLAGPWVVALAAQNLLTETFRGFRDLRRATLFGSIVGGVGFAALLLLCWISGAAPGLRGAVALQLAAVGLALLLALFAALRLLRRLPAGGGAVAAECLRLAGPFLGVALVYFMLAQADLWVLGACRPEEDVALYGAAARLALLVNMPLFVVNAVLPPLLASLHAGGSRRELERVLRASATLASYPAVLLGMLFLLAGGPMLRVLFGDYYAAAGPVLAVLTLGQVVNTVAGSCGVTLLMTGHQRSVLQLSLVVGGATIAAAVVAARVGGPLGVAWVILGSQVVQNGGLWLLARNRLGVCTHADFSAGPRECLRVLRDVR